jgi:hypothetical protein
MRRGRSKNGEDFEMKYLLVAQIDVPEKITSWEVFPDDGRDVVEFFRLCVSEIKAAKVNGFACGRLDGQDQAAAIDGCVTVAEGAGAIKEALA